MEYFPEIYVNRLATFKEVIKHTWRKIICITLPKLTPKGHRVFYIGGNPHKPTPRVEFLDVFQCFLACLEASVLQFRISLHSMIVVDTRFLNENGGSLDKIKFRQFLDRYMPLCRGGALPINVEKIFFLFSVKNDAMWKIYKYILNFDLGDME
uniref:CRAL-TRIO domain-containing protein n=1 Tax=Rhodnius prolixus TaxID=13249 RepID=T1IF16_RHOPR